MAGSASTEGRGGGWPRFVISDEGGLVVAEVPFKEAIRRQTAHSCLWGGEHTRTWVGKIARSGGLHERRGSAVSRALAAPRYHSK
jgi:hypothetical protein